MKKTILLVTIASLMMVFFTACNNYGTKMELEGGELYYTENVSEEEAKKLGEWLETYYLKGNPGAAVQIDKDGETYLAKFVIKDEIDVEDQAIGNFAGELQIAISQLFDDAKVNVHLCDGQLETRKEFKW